MQRILFVDDEPKVLEGLSRLLHSKRNQWDLVFAVGGSAALGELEKASFDAVVTDLGMPGIDGATLLERVKHTYPEVVRVVLSGEARRESGFRAAHVAHQYLSKPCDSTALIDVLERACRLKLLLSDPRLRTVIGELDTLPSSPQLYNELNRRLLEPEITIGDVAAILETDIGMTAKILQLVNSSFFGLARRLTLVREAVVYLGFGMVRNLVASESIFRTFAFGKDVPKESLMLLQRDSFLTASVARRLSRSRVMADNAFAAGILGDVGQLVLASHKPDVYRQVMEAARASGRPVHEVERERIGGDHGAVGAYLLGLWGLPMQVVDVVAEHHTVPAADKAELTLHRVVYLARMVVQKATAEIEGLKVEPHETFDANSLVESGIDASWPDWHNLVSEQYQTWNRIR